MLSLILAASLVVETPRVVHVSTVQDLREKCGVARSIDACTTLVDFELSASCDAGGALEASARFTPLMILFADGAHRHELLHISDIRASVETHLRVLQSTVYPSVEVCQEAAQRASQNFARDLAAFARASNEIRHATLRRAK